LGAFGKRSNLDKKLDREFISHPSPWLAVKNHYLADFPADTVGLHNFDGGYCGLSKTESGAVNVCYLASFESFKRFKNVVDFQNEVLCKNRHLDAFFASAQPVFETPLTISQISFEDKPLIGNHILMLGDAAGLIHPLCGNGMAMAMHSAKIASESIIAQSDNFNRNLLEKQYARAWYAHFNTRMRSGRMLSKALLHPKLSRMLLGTVKTFPSLLPKIVSMTHGKPINTAA
ncbi:MAG: FAD-dependent oxidoreductase, partial [Flavobacterium sp.]